MLSILRNRTPDQVQQDEIKHLVEEAVEELLETEQIMRVPPVDEGQMPFDPIEDVASE